LEDKKRERRKGKGEKGRRQEERGGQGREKGKEK